MSREEYSEVLVRITYDRLIEMLRAENPDAPEVGVALTVVNRDGETMTLTGPGDQIEASWKKRKESDDASHESAA